MSLVLVVSLHVIHEEFLAQVFQLRCPAGSGPTGLWVSGNSHVACSIRVSHVVLLLKSHSPWRTPEESKKGSNADFIQVTVTSALQDCLHVPAPSISCSPHAALSRESSAVPFIIVLHDRVCCGSPWETLVLRGFGVHGARPRISLGIVCPAALTPACACGAGNA